jgi:CubicO group peptidase (beta-lactamase class C family)
MESCRGLAVAARAAAGATSVGCERGMPFLSEGGFSEERLERLHEVMAGYVERGVAPGIVTLVSRGGDEDVAVVGTTAVGGDEPMTRDTIFRIASMTKPITAVAAMILVEECKLRLDDPVDEFLPELANRQVLRSRESELDDTVPANRPITLRDLLTFRLGIGLVFGPEPYPIQRAMVDQLVGFVPNPQAVPEPDEWMRRLGSLPLIRQPGEAWLYGTGSNVLSVLIARAAGQSMGDFMRERLFEPLAMNDTGFSVPADKMDRLPTSYGTDVTTGELTPFDDPAKSNWSSPPAFESGAGGLVSTVDDLYAFGQMLLNKGTYGDVRILSRPSVELMTTDQLTPEQKAIPGLVPGFWEDHGWGFGVAINTKRTQIYASPGRFGWFGGYGTSWYVDPAEGVIGILLTQAAFASADPPAIERDFWTGAYQAIEG